MKGFTPRVIIEKVKTCGFPWWGRATGTAPSNVYITPFVRPFPENSPRRKPVESRCDPPPAGEPRPPFPAGRPGRRRTHVAGAHGRRGHRGTATGRRRTPGGCHAGGAASRGVRGSRSTALRRGEGRPARTTTVGGDARLGTGGRRHRRGSTPVRTTPGRQARRSPVGGRTRTAPGRSEPAGCHRAPRGERGDREERRPGTGSSGGVPVQLVGGRHGGVRPQGPGVAAGHHFHEHHHARAA